jgi:hypothetical protein
LRIQFVQFFFGVTELVRLARSTWRIGFGKEIEDQRLPPKILKIYFLARLRRQSKIGRFIANVKHDLLLTWKSCNKWI